MKIKNVIVLIENTKGDVRQILLTDEQQDWVASLINKLHEGKIKLSPEVLTNVKITENE